MSLKFLVQLTCLSLGVFTGAAQESIQYGSISGRVEDPTGAVIEAAKVSFRRTDTNSGGTLLTDKEGRFRFPYLSVGEYEIRVQRPGFADAIRSVHVGVGSAFELPIVMGVASSTSDVTVTAQSDLLETARTQVAGTVSQSEVRSLPLNGRNLLDLALLIPGVSPPTPLPTSSSPRLRRSPARGFPWEASAISPTASLSMACPITTMRQASREHSTASML